MSKAKQIHQFETRTVMRSQVEFHSRNPRMIDKHAFSKLVKTLKKNRLVAPLQVNERVAEKGWEGDDIGKLVVIGGNQRMTALDKITGYDSDPENNDYELPITVIHEDEAREYEILIALNNQAIQGTFDYAMLEDLLSSRPINLEATGFERMDLAVHFDTGVLDGLLGEAPAKQIKEERSVIEDMMATKSAGTEAKKAEREAERAAKAAAAPDDDDESFDAADDDEYREPGEKIPYVNATPASERSRPIDDSDFPPPGSQGLDEEDEEFQRRVDAEFEKRSEMQARKKEYRESVAEVFSNEFYLVMVAENTQQMKRFLRMFDLPEDMQYFPLNRVAEALGVDLDGEDEESQA